MKKKEESKDKEVFANLPLTVLQCIAVLYTYFFQEITGIFSFEPYYKKKALRFSVKTFQCVCPAP